ncbi:SurA N-terminal domain-containing protein [Maridesulfovibrio sp.]|uniref:SurA N-terminal domain-containing protein n=1 Tax=Maridesulfovibrio sp. TaxID=2795000 RepID=UPI002A186EC4|nr:SurA N-terminal domain-containing protein [Maridesulfovibrio sp.]
MKHVVVAVFIAFICLYVQSAVADEITVDGIVADVNGDVITMFDLNFKMAPIMKQFKGRELTAVEEEQLKKIRSQILDRMINEIIIDQEASRLKIEVSPQDVDNEIKSIKENSNLTDEEFEQRLALQKTTLAEFKEKLRKDIRQHRLLAYKVKSKVVVTDDEIRAAWNSTRTSDVPQTKNVHLKLILFPENVSAAKIREEILSGGITFEQAADKYTTGPGAGSGGDLGVLNWDDLAQTWHDALEGLKPGEISQPFDVQSFKALLKLDSYAAAVQEGSFEDEKDEIYERLYRQKQDDVFAEYIKKLREKAVIDFK